MRRIAIRARRHDSIKTIDRSHFAQNLLEPLIYVLMRLILRKHVAEFVRKLIRNLTPKILISIEVNIETSVWVAPERNEGTLITYPNANL
jgi:hypothetical protein